MYVLFYSEYGASENWNEVKCVLKILEKISQSAGELYLPLWEMLLCGIYMHIPVWQECKPADCSNQSGNQNWEFFHNSLFTR